MKIKSLFRSLTKFEWCLWTASVVVVIGSFVLSGSSDILTIIASLIGVTALIFVAKGYVFGQVLTVIFAVFYGIISFYFKYYGEMITYLCMTSPIAVFSIITWAKNPFQKTAEVEVNNLNRKQIGILVVSIITITIAFYFILKRLGNANLIISTVSVATSFTASYFTLLRSPFYAIGYAANDVVLIVLWILAAVENISYLPMVLCFFMFLLNDFYGFFNWRRMKQRQENAFVSNV